jgi:hypothetical protein
MSEAILLKGAKAICRVVGRDWRQMANLVRVERLPAWRESKNGMWFARREDLEAWAARRAQKFIFRENTIENR